MATRQTSGRPRIARTIGKCTLIACQMAGFFQGSSMNEPVGLRPDRYAKLCKQRVDRFAFAVLCYVERTTFGDVMMIRGDAQRFVDRRVYVRERHGVLDRNHRV